MLNPLTSPLLAQFPLIKHGFFTRMGGVSQGIHASLNLSKTKGDREDFVQENHKRILEWFDRKPLMLMNQVHEDNILFVTEVSHDKILPKVDGLITNSPGLVLGVLTADCIPIFLADPEAGFIGAVHSGWRGTVKNIAGKAVQQMKKHGAHKIYATLGPAIGQENFEVAGEVYEAFDSQFKDFFKASSSPNRYLCDLKGIVVSQLAQEEVQAVEVLPYDTYATPELFFSCRRSNHQGENQFGCQFSGITITSKEMI